MVLKRDNVIFFASVMRSIARGGRVLDSRVNLQHGDTSVLLHSTAVAYYSWAVFEKYRIRCNRIALIKGALLHDYFLYDWHKEAPKRGIHGFSHPALALENAERDFNLSQIERDIISRHMFPLTLIPPRSREGAVVCAVDKILTIYEFFFRGTYPHLLRLIKKYSPELYSAYSYRGGAANDTHQ